MKALLHICCAVCAAPCIERLRAEGHHVCGFFYNPNIQPEEEYQRRLKEVQRLSQLMNFPLIIGCYEPDTWQELTKDYRYEPEGGARCQACFKLRLEKTLDLAKQKAFDSFTTTLTVSPHKNTLLINRLGHELSANLFLARDFKKKDGFKRAQDLSRQYNLYHQDYCGCLISRDTRRKDAQVHLKTRPSGH